MALEDILKRIQEKNKRDISNIKREASKKCKKIEKEGKEEIKRLDEQNKRESEEKISRLKEHMFQEARLNMAKKELEAKSDLIEEVSQGAIKKFKELPEKDYMSWLKKTVKEIAEPGESEIILPTNFKKKQDIKELLQEVNREFKGKKHIRLSDEARDVNTGFILKQSRKEFNCSFQSLLEERADSLRVKVSQLLFGKKN